jgi:hypothetical protein
MSARGKRLPLLKDPSRDYNRTRREILRKILADPRFEGFRLGQFWPPEKDLHEFDELARTDGKGQSL